MLWTRPDIFLFHANMTYGWRTQGCPMSSMVLARGGRGEFRCVVVGLVVSGWRSRWLRGNRHPWSARRASRDVPPHWERLKAGQELRPDEKVDQRRQVKHAWTCRQRRGRRRLHQQSPCQEHLRQRWPQEERQISATRGGELPFRISEYSSLSRKMCAALRSYGRGEENRVVVHVRRLRVFKEKQKGRTLLMRGLGRGTTSLGAARRPASARMPLE